ncbi:hypothetical protein [Lewinella sp. W8]|uniref:hypothetical protein n=1 Tax=Lewinella sp. W8 TaxID=2528208 RepID=UPI001067F476|nr:hypothetical protein [Lewinella sp. W8]MTB52833.1 hypothetical protein [Lewinella sp. W8]
MAAPLPLMILFRNYRPLLLWHIAPLCVLYFGAHFLLGINLLLPRALFLCCTPLLLSAAGLALFLMGPMLAVPLTASLIILLRDFLQWYATAPSLNLPLSFCFLLIPLGLRVALTILSPLRFVRNHLLTGIPSVPSPRVVLGPILSLLPLLRTKKVPPRSRPLLGKAVGCSANLPARKIPSWVSEAGELILSPFNLLPEFSFVKLLLYLLS